MKKVALFIPSMYPSGGAERVTHQLANDLSNEFEVTVITLVENIFEDTLYQKKSLGFSHSKLSKIWSLLYGPIALAQYCKKNDIECVISHMERANFIALFAKKISKIKTLCVVHGSKHIHKKRNSYLMLLLYKTADMIITVSQGIENNLRKNFNLKNIQTIYNYFDFQQINQKINEPVLSSDQHLFNNNLHTFITIGRLVPVKDQEFLIRSFASLTKKDSQLLIIGSGPLKKTLISLARELNVESRVHLLGIRKNVFPLLNASDCFVLSSKWEGFGLVLVEALAAGLPIISTNCVSGPAEIIQTPEDSFGTLIKPGNQKAFTRALQKSLHTSVDPNKQKLRASVFSKDKIISIWISLIQK